MSTNAENRPAQSSISLVRGILVDLEHLVEQQLQLTRREMEDELRQRSADAMIVAIGIGILFLAAGGFCLAFAHLLHWFSSPAGADPAWFPLWACHGVIAVALAVVGGILTHVGRTKFGSVERCQNPVTEIFEDQKS